MIDRLGSFLLGPNDTVENGVYLGDLRILGKEIPDESVDLIHTDPPYPREFEYLWYVLGDLAARVLKPGGSLITLLGQYQLPLVMDALSTLTFRWIGWLVHKGPKATLFGYRIVCGGKPFLWYVKGDTRIKGGFFWDTRISPKPDKRYHKWGQPTTFVSLDIERLTKEGDIVLDPMCGGGTVPYCCASLGRRWLSFDIDPKAVKVARKRLESVQLLLTEPQAEQVKMEM